MEIFLKIVNSFLFFRIVFHKCKLGSFCYRLIVKKYSYLASVYWKYQQIKQTAPGLNRGVSSNWLGSVNHVKFIEKCVICTGTYIIAKIFADVLNSGLPLRVWVKKKSILFEKQKFESQWPCRQYSKTPIDYLDKDGTINNASYYQLF